MLEGVSQVYIFIFYEVSVKEDTIYGIKCNFQKKKKKKLIQANGGVRLKLLWKSSNK